MNAQNSNDARKTGYGESRSAIKRRKSFPLYHLVFRATHATTVILTLRLKVRRRFDVSNIPRYNYGYTRALNNRKHYLQNCSIMIVEDVSLKANAQNKYYVSKQDQDISTIRTYIYVERLLPISTMSDNSYISAPNRWLPSFIRLLRYMISQFFFLLVSLLFYGPL